MAEKKKPPTFIAPPQSGDKEARQAAADRKQKAREKLDEFTRQAVGGRSSEPLTDKIAGLIEIYQALREEGVVSREAAAHAIIHGSAMLAAQRFLKANPSMVSETLITAFESIYTVTSPRAVTPNVETQRIVDDAVVNALEEAGELELVHLLKHDRDELKRIICLGRKHLHAPVTPPG